MKASKHYEEGGINVFVHESKEVGKIEFDYDCLLNFDNEQQMRRLGECLIDLARIGGSRVSIGETPEAKQ